MSNFRFPQPKLRPPHLIPLSADEGAAIHEKMTRLGKNFHKEYILVNGKNGAWMTVYFILFGTQTAFSSKPIARMWNNYREIVIITAIGAAVFVTGACFHGDGGGVGAWRWLIAAELCERYG